MRKPTPLIWFAVLSLIAIGLALGLPPDPHALQQLHTTSEAYRTAVALLLIPYILIWYAGFYAYDKLRGYSSTLKGTADGRGFRLITAGMGVLAFSLIIPTIITLILRSFAAFHPAYLPAATIISNYVNLFPGVVAFLLLFSGARRLIRTTSSALEKRDLRWHGPWFLLLCVVFSHLVITNHTKIHPYYLSLELLIVTFIVPYLYGWMVGLLSANDLRHYAATVKGSLYQRGIKMFARGVFVAIIGSIAIQFVNIALAQRFDKSLGAVLLIDYGLLAVVAAGLILMALGTKKLKRIEDI